MLDASNVIPLRAVPQMIHDNTTNEPGFDDEVTAVLRAGAVMVLLERAKAALRDPRLQRAHRYVLAELIDLTHYGDGTAWPSRQTLAARAGITDGVLRNTLSELRAFGYVSWARRRRDGEGRTLLHYVMPIARVDYATLTEAIRKLREEKLPARLSPPGVTNTNPVSPQGVTKSDKTSRPAVTMPKVSPQEVKKLSPQEVQKVSPQEVQQELSTKELLEIDSEEASPSAPATPGSRSCKGRPAPSKVRTELRPDWSIKDNPEWGEWALKHYANVTRAEVRDQLYAFRDYHHKEATTSADWFASWRTWCCRREKRPPWAKPGQVHHLWIKTSTADDDDELDLIAAKPEPKAPSKSEVDEDLEIWRERDERRRREDA